MKPQGRPCKPISEEEKVVILEYLESNLSYQEVAEKYGMTKDSLRYKVNKYRKENSNGEKNCDRGKTEFDS